MLQYMEYQSIKKEKEYIRSLEAWTGASLSLKAVTIVKVHDGDTITVSHPSHKVPIILRVAEIDAPEFHAFTWPNQPYCTEARDVTVSFCAGPGEVDVHLNKYDPRTSRWIGHVLVNGQDLSLHLATVGAAWSYIADKGSKVPAAVAAAKAAAIGLWATPGAIEPSTWRRMPHPKAG